MKQFLQIHNTDCNKRTIFRTFLQWENEKSKTQRRGGAEIYFEHGRHEGNGNYYGSKLLLTDNNYQSTQSLTNKKLDNIMEEDW